MQILEFLKQYDNLAVRFEIGLPHETDRDAGPGADA
jgi:hypothetical protein